MRRLVRSVLLTPILGTFFVANAFASPAMPVELLAQNQNVGLTDGVSAPPIVARGFRSIASGGADNFAAVVKLDGSPGRSIIWGANSFFSSPQPLCVPTAFATGGGSAHMRQTAFEQTCGMTASGLICYSSMMLDNDSPSIVTSGQARMIDSLWRHQVDPDTGAELQVPLQIDGQAVPNQAGRYWRAVSRPGISSDGTPNWVGATADSPTNFPTDVAIYSGMGEATRRLLGVGDAVTDWGLRVSGAAFSHHAFSPDGSRLIAIAKLDGLSQSAEQSILLGYPRDQAVRPTIMAETGDIAEPTWQTWKEFTHVAMANPTPQAPDGIWMIAGELDARGAGVSRRFAIARADAARCRVILREGDVIGPASGVRRTEQRMLVGRPMSLTANANGDWAALWWTKVPDQATNTTLPSYPIPTLVFGGASAGYLLTFADLFLGGAAVDASGYPTRLDPLAIQDIAPIVAVSDRDTHGVAQLFVVVITGRGTQRLEHLIRCYVQADATGCPADLDDGSGTGHPDGGVDINDLLYFLAVYQGGSPMGDLDDGTGLGVPDGGVDINDLLFFLAHYQEGC